MSKNLTVIFHQIKLMSFWFIHPKNTGIQITSNSHSHVILDICLWEINYYFLFYFLLFNFANFKREHLIAWRIKFNVQFSEIKLIN